jgi:uncharacterized coiled-coil protein SlyX
MNIRTFPTEFWAAITAVVTGLALITKKLITRHRALPKPKLEPVSRTEFRFECDVLRHRLGALSEKLDAVNSTLTSEIRTLARLLREQSVSIERRLDRLDNAVARLDERTKTL